MMLMFGGPTAATRQKPRQIGPVYTSGGAVAQLGERLVRNEEVRGSTPLGSTSRLVTEYACPAAAIGCGADF